MYYFVLCSFLFSLFFSSFAFSSGKSCCSKNFDTEEEYNNNDKIIPFQNNEEVFRSLLSSSSLHDLKGKLNIINGAAQLGIKNKDDQDKVSYYHRIVSQSIEELKVMIRGISHQNEKIEFGMIQNFFLNDALNTIAKNTEIQTEIKKIKLIWKNDQLPKDPILVQGNKITLFRIFENLIGNAIKFTKEKGLISVKVELGKFQNQEMIVLNCEIKDSGIGMSEETLKHLFEPFFSKKTENLEGTGLGLFNTRKLIEKMGGNIYVHSQPGIGTSFKFDLSFLPSNSSTDLNQAQEKDESNSPVFLALNEKIEKLSKIQDFFTILIQTKHINDTIGFLIDYYSDLTKKKPIKEPFRLKDLFFAFDQTSIQQADLEKTKIFFNESKNFSSIENKIVLGDFTRFLRILNYLFRSSSERFETVLMRRSFKILKEDFLMLSFFIKGEVPRNPIKKSSFIEDLIQKLIQQMSRSKFIKWIDSESEEVNFTIYLKLFFENETENLMKDDKEKLKIGILDDDYFSAYALSSILSQENKKYDTKILDMDMIESFDSNEIADNLYPLLDFDLIFIDYQLGQNYSGIDLTREIRKIDKKKVPTKIILVTGFQCNTIYWEAADCCIEKPVDFRILKTLLETK